MLLGAVLLTAALGGCEDEEVKGAVQPVSERCDAAKSSEDWGKCLADIKAVADKYPQNAIAVCARQTIMKKAATECSRDALVKIFDDPELDTHQTAIDRCKGMEKDALAACEACSGLGGPPEQKEPLKCEINPDTSAAGLEQQWAAKKEEVKQKKGPCAGTENRDKPLCNPKLANEKAPDKFKVKLETTKGDFVIEATRAWAPNGVDRFYNLVKIGYYKDIALFRVEPGFVVQFGIHGTPGLSKIWIDAKIPDDKVVQSNQKGTVTYAKAGPDTRSCQLFINYADNTKSLDKQGFAAIGKVVEGMKVAESFYSGYGGKTLSKQGDIIQQGNKYLKSLFPELDYIKSATLLEK